MEEIVITPRNLGSVAASARWLTLLFLVGVCQAATYYVSDAGGSVTCGTDGTQTTQAYNFTGYAASDTLKLCGKITHDLVIQKNGVSIIFESGASLQIPACGNGCIQLNGKTGGLIDGGTPCGPGTSCSTNFGDYGMGSVGSGLILQTTVGTPAATITNITCSGGVATVTGPAAFGYSLPNQPKVTISGNSISSYNGSWTVASNTDSSKQFTFNAGCSGTGSGGQVGVLCPSGSYCSSTASTNMIDGQSAGGSGWEIRNLLIGPYYLRTSFQDVGGGSEWESIYEQGCNGCSSKIHDNTMANAGVVYVPVSSGDNGLQIYNNAFLGGGDSMVIPGSGSSNNLSGAQIHDNYIADNGIGDAPGCPAHLDGIHIWGLSGATESGVNFYNNWFSGNFGHCQTGAVYFEGNNQNYNIYNNVFTTTYDQANNGLVSINGPGPFLVANNTIIGQNVSDTCFEFQGNNWSTPGGQISFENNIISGCSTAVVLKDSPTLTSWDYNAYSLGGFNLDGAGYNGGSPWKNACSCDSHSLYYSNSSSLDLDSGGAPQSGSPAINAGLDLSGLGIVPLNSDTSAGDTRTPTSRSSPWTIGAFDAGTGVSPAPPTGLSATVQ
jgi:hypothetical protein